MNPLVAELRSYLADRLVWWAFRLDPTRFFDGVEYRPGQPLRRDPS